MNNKIAIITSGHNPFDERLFHKFAHTFNKNNFDTAIFCSTDNISETRDGILIKGFSSENLNKRGKINKFCDMLIEFKPDIIICAEILPILAAKRYKKELNKMCRIVYDLTEWYPENYSYRVPALYYYLLFPFLYLLQYYAVQKVDAIIYGEARKIKRFNLLAPTKKKKHISYYPVLEYFDYSPPPFNGKKLTLCFSGLLKKDRGIFRFCESVLKFYELDSRIDISIKLIGKFDCGETRVQIENIFKNKPISIEFIEWQPYANISKVLKDVDICFDLRDKNFIHDNSLPIKIFEYMACGKPVIYSNIPALLDLFKDDEIGFFVDFDDTDEAASRIGKYVNDKDLLARHSKKGRELAERYYNWGKIEDDLVKFVTEI